MPENANVRGLVAINCRFSSTKRNPNSASLGLKKKIYIYFVLILYFKSVLKYVELHVYARKYLTPKPKREICTPRGKHDLSMNARSKAEVCCITQILYFCIFPSKMRDFVLKIFCSYFKYASSMTSTLGSKKLAWISNKEKGELWNHKRSHSIPKALIKV